ncbi:HAD family hydrolase [Cellulomonas sp. NPDC055163]
MTAHPTPTPRTAPADRTAAAHPSAHAHPVAPARPAGPAAGPTVVACDLDRTLIYSRAAMALPDGPEPELVCVEHYDGAPLSYVTGRAERLLVELAASAVVVPTTTRTRAQLARIRIPGPPSPYAIAANGGILLVDGEPDAAWTAAVRELLAASSVPLADVREHMRTAFDDAWTLSRREAEELFCYAVVDRAALPAGFVEDLSGWAAERGWTVSLQGRKLYVVPAALTKGAAVTALADRVGAARVLAAGDSLLDADLLDAAHAGVRPAHGELAESGWTRPHVAVTPRAGILAGEDVLTWLLGEVARGTGGTVGTVGAHAGSATA